TSAGARVPPRRRGRRRHRPRGRRSPRRAVQLAPGVTPRRTCVRLPRALTLDQPPRGERFGRRDLLADAAEARLRNRRVLVLAEHVLEQARVLGDIALPRELRRVTCPLAELTKFMELFAERLVRK